jgi:hypothetical protein
MSTICLLLDEHVPRLIRARLEQIAPEMRVYAIGDGFAPANGTLDPDILVWIEAHGCMLITNNRASMPVHLQAHLDEGRHVPGIMQLPKQMNINTVLDDVLLIWGASLPAEFQDQIVYLPLRR